MITRRRVLQGMCSSAAAAAAHTLWAPAAAFASNADHTLVTVFLRGGMDGLSAVVPFADPRYRQARPNIAVEGADRLPLGRGFGLHPALKPLHELRSMLAVVHGSGQISSNRSHFDSMHIIETGGEAVGQFESGWLARHLAATNATAAPLHAVSWGNTPPASLNGNTSALSLGSLANFGLAADRRIADSVLATLRTLYGGDEALGNSAAATFAALDEVTRIRETAPEPAVEYPNSHLGRSLGEIARTIKADAGLVAATVDVGGWDTHEGMGNVDNGRMVNLLDDLGRSLHSFVRDLGGRMKNVTLVTMSEFGRRVQENGSGGVDHGRGTAMMVLGQGVKAGVHGDWAGLDEAALDQGDVPVVNDYRSVLADVLTGRMGGTDLAHVFPGWTHQRLGLA